MTRTVERSVRFRRDYRRELKQRHAGLVERRLLEAIGHLVVGRPLPPSWRDHALIGDRVGLRDCHLRPDLVLIYRLTDDELTLVRLGSHSELGIG